MRPPPPPRATRRQRRARARATPTPGSDAARLPAAGTRGAQRAAASRAPLPAPTAPSLRETEPPPRALCAPGRGWERHAARRVRLVHRYPHRHSSSIISRLQPSAAASSARAPATPPSGSPWPSIGRRARRRRRAAAAARSGGGAKVRPFLSSPSRFFRCGAGAPRGGMGARHAMPLARPTTHACPWHEATGRDRGRTPRGAPGLASTPVAQPGTRSTVWDAGQGHCRWAVSS